MSPAARRPKRSIYHVPWGENLWVWPMLLAVVLSAIECAVMWVIECMAVIGDREIPHSLPILLGALVWAALAGAGLLSKLVAGRLFRTLELDTEKLSVSDAKGVTSLVGASAVEVRPRWLWGASVVVEGASGELWRSASGLRRSHARALAMDIAEMLSLSLPSEGGAEPKPVPPGRFEQAVFEQDQDSVRIALWSAPVRDVFIALVTSLSSSIPGLFSLFNLSVFPGMSACILQFLATAALAQLMARRLPWWTEVEICSDRLVVRSGMWLRRVQTLPLATVAEPRLVRSARGIPSLVVRSHDGVHFEWLNYSSGVLRRVQEWIVYARTFDSPAPQEVPQALLELSLYCSERAPGEGASPSRITSPMSY